MSEFIVFSDIQWYKNPRKSFMRADGISSWTYEQMKILNQIVDYAHKNQVRDIFHNGDFFHEKTRIPQDLYNGIWSIFRELNNKGFRFILNTGNHDLYLQHAYSSLKPFSDICQIVRRPTHLYMGNTHLCFVPFGMTKGNLSFEKDPTGKIKSHILFIHEEIAGLKVGPLDYTLGSPLKPQALREWDLVFNGHVHKPQEFKNIINIGSPMVQDWGEAGEVKRFIHYRNGEIISIPIDCPKFIYVNGLSDRIINKMKNDDRNFYKVDIEHEEIDDSIFKKYNVQPNITKSKEREVRMKPAKSNVDEVEEYIRIAGMPAKLDKDKLVNVAKQIMEE